MPGSGQLLLSQTATAETTCVSKNNPSGVTLTGEYQLPLDTEATWIRLNQPDVLQYCIRGCDEVIRHRSGNYTARFSFGFGPLKKNIDARLEVQDIAPPARYRLVAGLRTRRLGDASGTAAVTLTPLPQGCTLQYVADVSVSGWFSRFGDEVVEAAAARAMKLFFDRFIDLID